MPHGDAELEVPVLIAGGRPVGLSASIMPSRYRAPAQHRLEIVLGTDDHGRSRIVLGRGR